VDFFCATVIVSATKGNSHNCQRYVSESINSVRGVLEGPRMLPGLHRARLGATLDRGL
jgi:hypothetical protein